MPSFSVFFELSPATASNPRPEIAEHITEADSWTAAVQGLAGTHGYDALQYRACCELIQPGHLIWSGATLSEFEANAYNRIWRAIKRYQAEGLTAPENLHDEAHRLIAAARKSTEFRKTTAA